VLPKRFPDREEIATVRTEAAALEPGAEGDREHRLAGRVLARRDMGKLLFLDLVDRSGRIQLLIRPDELGGVDVDLGDIVGVSGLATKTKRGEPSLSVRELTVLGKIRTSLPDTFHGLIDTEARYRKRYLDLLMNEDTRRDALVRSRNPSSHIRTVSTATSTCASRTSCT
jgi:lysyl-tRNA synthetase, class II